MKFVTKCVLNFNESDFYAYNLKYKKKYIWGCLKVYVVSKEGGYDRYMDAYIAGLS